MGVPTKKIYIYQQLNDVFGVNMRAGVRNFDGLGVA
jgi:hypothetical protein